MNRVAFLIDGFNLYHSTKTAGDHTGSSTKWLDIRAMCSSYLSAISRDAYLHSAYYFSALATHLEAIDPGKVQRHRDFIECLEDTGVVVQLGKFKRKRDFSCPNCGNNRCGHCGARHKQREEKETDVAIAAKMLELLFTNACDTLVIVTGDTDLAPAFHTAKRLFPGAEIRFALPYERHTKLLRQIAPTSFRIGKEGYTKHQFPDPFILRSGRKISKPPSW
jgi:uncharacterized LabA/DUF88 family protein